MFDYGNTRLRAVKARLLTQADLEALAGAGSLEAFIDRLLRTGYRRPLQRALATSDGIRAVEYAVRLRLEQFVERLRLDFSGRAGQAITTMLSWYDLQNVKTVLRGLAGDRDPADVERACTLFGSLDPADLRMLSGADSIRAGIDLMASAGLPAAAPLVRYRTEHPGAGLFEFEITLNHWFFQETGGNLRDPSALAGWLGTLADHENLQTVLRLAHDPGLVEALENDRGIRLGDLLLDFGELDRAALSRAGAGSSVEVAIDLLGGSRYSPALQEGLIEYRASGRLSAFEESLSAHHHARLRRDIIMQPLGLAVPIAVQALVVDETANLRWIAWGIHIGLAPAEIKDELIVPV